MKRQRWAVAGIAIVAALAFGATGCTTSSGGSTPTASPRSGLDVLTDAVAKTKGQSYQFAVVYGTTLSGSGMTSGDGAATSLNVTITDPGSGINIKLTALVLKTAAYAKIDLGQAAGAVVGINPNTWVHIDPKKAPGAARLGISPGQDIFGPQTYVKAVDTATVDSPTQVSGNLDLAKTALPGLALTQIPAGADGKKTVSFTATLDDQGRISKITVNVPAAGTLPAADLTSTYSNWGVAVNVTAPPASQTVEAPPIVYTFLQ